jgi:putative PIN family toxin of toxin-antitoxin system
MTRSKVVLDTNVLVSALLKPDSNPGKVLDLIISGSVVCCHTSLILKEYQDVLARPKFGFDQGDVMVLVTFLEKTGLSVVPPLAPEKFEDESDRIFYETALFVNGFLITGNLKHFPPSKKVLLPGDYLKAYFKSP